MMSLLLSIHKSSGSVCNNEYLNHSGLVTTSITSQPKRHLVKVHDIIILSITLLRASAGARDEICAHCEITITRI